MASEASKWPWRVWFLATTSAATAGTSVAACGMSNSCAAYLYCPQDYPCPVPSDAATDGEAGSLGDATTPDGARTDAPSSGDGDAGDAG